MVTHQLPPGGQQSTERLMAAKIEQPSRNPHLDNMGTGKKYDMLLVTIKPLKGQTYQLIHNNIIIAYIFLKSNVLI